MPPTAEQVAAVCAAMDARFRAQHRADVIEAVLHLVWLTLTFDAHRTPGGALSAEGERYLRRELERIL